MSWLSKNTGRPKEEGGHKRINISFNLHTRDVLDTAENKSKLVEYCIDVFLQPKWVVYCEPKVTSNGDSESFVEGASFEFAPYFNPGNAILGANCYFDYSCGNGGMEFRVTINDEDGLTLVEKSGGEGYTCSQVYDESELGFPDMKTVFYNQDKYVFKFEFRPLRPSGRACVKDVYLSVQVIESPLLNMMDGFLI